MKWHLSSDVKYTLLIAEICNVYKLKTKDLLQSRMCCNAIILSNQYSCLKSVADVWCKIYHLVFLELAVPFESTTWIKRFWWSFINPTTETQNTLIDHSSLGRGLKSIKCSVHKIQWFFSTPSHDSTSIYLTNLLRFM